MTVLTNLWLAYPNAAILALIILAAMLMPPRLAPKSMLINEGPRYQLFVSIVKSVMVLIFIIGLIQAATSPIFLKKNEVDATDSSIVESRKLNEVEEAEAISSTPVDRMPKHKQRDNFVHDMKRKGSE
jgi:hypothetical protein